MACDFAVHLVDALQSLPGVVQQRLLGRRQTDAARSALQQRLSHQIFQLGDALTDRRHRELFAFGRPHPQFAALGNGDEEWLGEFAAANFSPRSRPPAPVCAAPRRAR